MLLSQQVKKVTYTAAQREKKSKTGSLKICILFKKYTNPDIYL